MLDLALIIYAKAKSRRIDNSEQNSISPAEEILMRTVPSQLPASVSRICIITLSLMFPVFLSIMSEPAHFRAGNQEGMRAGEVLPRASIYPFVRLPYTISPFALQFGALLVIVSLLWFSLIDGCNNIYGYIIPPVFWMLRC